MASKKSCTPIFTGLQFEFDESEVWETNNDEVEVEEASETRWSAVWNTRRHAKVEARKGGSDDVVDEQVAAAGASLPVKIPDWRRILGVEYKDHRHDNAEVAEYEDEDEDEEERLPPHEYLARTRVASLSVQEGVGRTLKGRDLWRVRNDIWKQIGFED